MGTRLATHAVSASEHFWKSVVFAQSCPSHQSQALIALCFEPLLPSQENVSLRWAPPPFSEMSMTIDPQCQEQRQRAKIISLKAAGAENEGAQNVCLREGGGVDLPECQERRRGKHRQHCPCFVFGVKTLGLHTTTRELQTCTVQGLWCFKHNQNSTKRPPREKKRKNMWRERGKKQHEILGGRAEGVRRRGGRARLRPIWANPFLANLLCVVVCCCVLFWLFQTRASMFGVLGLSSVTPPKNT